MENNNFSTVDYVFEYFDLYKPDFGSIQKDVMTLFPQIAINVSSKVSTIESDLSYIFNNSTIASNRFYALSIYEEIFGIDVLNMALIGIEDDDYTVRSISLDFLDEYEYNDLNSILKVRLTNDPAPTIRTHMVDLLLQKFGEPSDLKAVIDYQPNESNETAKSLMNYSIQEFIPPRMKEPITIPQIFSKLINFISDLRNYGGIDSSVNVYYTNVLINIKDNNDYHVVRDQISLLLKLIEREYGENRVSIEGYKFIKYHLGFIDEKVADELN